MSYHSLPLIEYARGAVECALARGMSSHAILFSNKAYAEGGLYLVWSEVPFEETDKKAFIEKEKTLPEGAPATRISQGRFSTSTSARGKFLKVVDLSEDYEEQLQDIEEVYEKKTGSKYKQSTDQW